MENKTELGVEKLENLLEAMGDLVVSGKKVMADGKINLNDLPVAISLLSNVGDIIESIKEFKGAVAEAKDLEQDELLRLVTSVYNIVSKIEAA